MEAEMLDTMSEETLRGRFFENLIHVDHEMLVRFTNIDYDREMAIVAELTRGKKKRSSASVASRRGRPRRGEFAVVVHDDFQAKGSASSSRCHHRHRAGEGLREVTGYIDSNNRRMLKVVEELGFVSETNVDGVTTVRLDWSSAARSRGLRASEPVRA